MDNKEISKDKSLANRLWQYVRKNSFTMLMLVFIVVMFVSPDAKSFVLRQLMVTGLFDANIDVKGSDDATRANVDFDFVDQKGHVQNTSSLRGQVVFINFWASWCPPCRAEFPSIQRLYIKFKDNPDVFFMTINEDNDPAKGRAYLDKESFSVPMYQAIGNIPNEIYSGVLPTTLVLDKNGRMKFHHTGFANYASDKFVKQLEILADE